MKTFLITALETKEVSGHVDAESKEAALEVAFQAPGVIDWYETGYIWEIEPVNVEEEDE